mgnify:CR=1 FL=1
MKIIILSIGKENDDEYKEAIKMFENRLLRYAPISFLFLPHEVNKDKESEKILEKIKKDDYVVLLDEKGTLMKSEEFAGMIENRMIDSVRNIVFIIGGAYGVNEKLKERANYILKLSSFVFPHMLVRLILIEQIYRAFTILNNEKYHHQ